VPLVRIALTVVYLTFAVDILASERWAVPTLAHELRTRPVRT